MRGRRVLELGCGIGIVGLVCALAGADSVLMTDYQDVTLDTAEENARKNKLTPGRVSVCRYGDVELALWWPRCLRVVGGRCVCACGCECE